MRFRAEADFDIDITNYWWDTPHEVIKSWREDAGIVSHVQPDGPENKVSLGDLSWHSSENMNSIREFNENSAHAQFMRGVITKQQRILQYLKHYSSGLDVGDVGFSMKVSGGDTRVNQGITGKIVLNLDKGNWNPDIQRKLAKDIQDIVDSSTGFDTNRFGKAGDINVWLDKFLFGSSDGYYPGVFKIQSWDTQSGTYKGGERITNEVHKDIIKEAIKPYSTMLQLGTQVYSNGVKKSVRYDDIVSYMNDYDRQMGSLGTHTYWTLKNRHKGETDYIRALDKIFAFEPNKKGSGGKIRSQPFGQFGPNAQPNKMNKSILLPFERAMSAVAFNELKLDRNHTRLYGESLEIFEASIGKYEGGGDKSEALQEIVNNAKKDVRTLGFANYLEWDIRRKTKSMYDNPQWQEYLNEKIIQRKELLAEVESRFTSNKEIANRILQATALRIRNEILEGKVGKAKYKTPYKVNGKIVYFDNYWKAREWVNKESNWKHLLQFAKNQSKDPNKGPFKFVGINSESHLFNMTWGHMLGPFHDIHFMPEGNKGVLNREFQRDIRDTKKMYYELYKNYFNKRKREAHLDPGRIHNVMMSVVDQMYRKWDKIGGDYGAKNGLGQMFLFKVMAPKADPTTISYFNGNLMPTYTKGSRGLIKLGLKYIAEAETIGELRRRQLFEEFSSKSNAYFDMFYGQHLTAGFHDTQMIQMLHAEHASAYHSLAPLLDLDLSKKYTPVSMQETDINPNLARMFGHSENMGVGYMLSNYAVSPTAMGEMIRNAERTIMPVGYIPMDYMGMHPKINSWNSLNQARNDKLGIMFGDLTKGRLLYVDSPTIAKQPFTLSGSKKEKSGDIIDTIDHKGKTEGDTKCAN